MEHGFAEVHGKEIFRGRPGLSGKQVIVEKHEDSTITHRFTIDDVVRVSNGAAWYGISRHTTTIDKSEAIAAQLKEQSDALVELAEILEGMGV